jgi:hypothetical protein
MLLLVYRKGVSMVYVAIGLPIVIPLVIWYVCYKIYIKGD